jgi:hypothetical protein
MLGHGPGNKWHHEINGKVKLEETGQTISHWHIGAVQVDSSFWYILEDSKNMFVGFWCLLTTSLAEFLS